MAEGSQAPVTRQAFEIYKEQVEAAGRELENEIAQLKIRIANLESKTS